MENKKGTLYGVGVGPGDPQLMTLKAVRTIEECQVVAIPALSKERCVAYNIASQAAELKHKDILCVHMPMTKDAGELRLAHENGANEVKKYLDRGVDVAFLTLGDPTVYSTYIYIHNILKNRGYDTQIISGIPSFCAAAAALGISLSEKSQQIHVIPASYDLDKALELGGTKIFMKSGSRLGELKSRLKEAGAVSYMVENCGMDNEKIVYGVDDIDENAGYYSLVIAKDR